MSTQLTSALDRLWQWWKRNYADVARLCGVVGFLYGVFVDRGQNPALLPGAAGLIFLKNVVNGRSDL